MRVGAPNLNKPISPESKDDAKDVKNRELESNFTEIYNQILLAALTYPISKKISKQLVNDVMHCINTSNIKTALCRKLEHKYSKLSDKDTIKKQYAAKVQKALNENKDYTVSPLANPSFHRRQMIIKDILECFKSV